jgi:hypothetical protein
MLFVYKQRIKYIGRVLVNLREIRLQFYTLFYIFIPVDIIQALLDFICEVPRNS